MIRFIIDIHKYMDIYDLYCVKNEIGCQSLIEIGFQSLIEIGFQSLYASARRPGNGGRAILMTQVLVLRQPKGISGREELDSNRQ